MDLFNQNTLLFQGPDGLGTQLHGYLFTIEHKGLFLEIRKPDLLSVPLREAHIVAELLTFTGNVAFV